jgi:hypothetical protein
MASIISAMTEKPKPPSRTADQFVIRLPEGMRESIAAAAKNNNRSMNAEIIARIAQTFGPSDLDTRINDAVESKLSTMEKWLTELLTNHAQELAGSKSVSKPPLKKKS